LAYGIQHYSLIAWLSSAAIQVIIVKPLAAHLDELSVRDCETLFRLAQDWTVAPDVLALALERKRQAALAEVRRGFAQEGRAELKKLVQEVETQRGDGDPVLAAQLDGLSLPALTEVLAQTEAQVNAIFQRTQFALRLPYWERFQQAEERQEA